MSYGDPTFRDRVGEQIVNHMQNKSDWTGFAFFVLFTLFISGSLLISLVALIISATGAWG